MGDKPFIKFYPSDFLGGTSGLSPSERGVYMTLLCLIYENDGAVVRDDSRMSRQCGCPKAAFIKTISALIDGGKIIESDGKLTNSRAEKAIVDRANRVEISTHAANQRWDAQKVKNKQKQRQDNASALPGQCTSDAIPEPEPERDTIVSLSAKRRKKPSVSLPDDWVPDLTISARLKDEHSLTRDEMNFCYQQMKGHAHANDRKCVNWNAAFGNWIRKAVTDGQIGPGSRSRKSGNARRSTFD